MSPQNRKCEPLLFAWKVVPNAIWSASWAHQNTLISLICQLGRSYMDKSQAMALNSCFVIKIQAPLWSTHVLLSTTVLSSYHSTYTTILVSLASGPECGYQFTWHLSSILFTTAIIFSWPFIPNINFHSTSVSPSSLCLLFSSSHWSVTIHPLPHITAPPPTSVCLLNICSLVNKLLKFQ